MPHRPVLWFSALILIAVAGCGGGSRDDASSETKAPEALRTSAAAVAQGLAKIDTISTQIAVAASDKTKAGDLADQIEPVWQPIEGTVKANDAKAYLSFEDSFALLEGAAKDGDTSKAQQGAAGVTAAAGAYLKKFPG